MSANVPAEGQDCLPGSTRIGGVGKSVDFTYSMEDVSGSAASTFFKLKPDGKDGYTTSTISGDGVTQWPNGSYASFGYEDRTLGNAVTYVRFVYRGDFLARGAYLEVNGMLWSPPPPTDPQQWTTKTYDVTSGVVKSLANRAGIYFFNEPARAQSKGPATFEVDSFVVYQCTPIPSHARGDFDGDGIMDVLAVDGKDTLWMFPNYGTTGKLADPVIMQEGWAETNWIGSPGDLTGDGHADLLSRDIKGNLWCHAGDGVRGLAMPTLIGTWWQKMWAIVPTGDMDGDGDRDMLGLEAPGNLYRYTLVAGPTPKIINKTLIGVQFYEFRNLISSGDYNGDGTPDILGVKYDDTMWGYYTARGSGRLSAHGKFLGSGWKMKSVSSPGDFNGNGFDDVLALGPTNDLVLYYVKDGHWDGSVLLKSGFYPRLLA